MKKTEFELNRFAEIMWGLAEDFGGKVSNNGVKLRFEALKEYDIDQISIAATWLFKNRTKDFPAIPTTKEIIDAIKAIENPAKMISIESRAEIQADIVLNKLRVDGASSSDFVKLEDPITSKLMTTRWPYRRWAETVLEKDLVWWRKEFVEAYKAYLEVEDVQEAIECNRGDLKQLTSGMLKAVQ